MLAEFIKHGPLFFHCRDAAVKELVTKYRMNFYHAHDVLERLTNDQIVGHALAQGMSQANADSFVSANSLPLLASIWQWIVDHREIILKIIMAIISLVLMFAAAHESVATGRDNAKCPMPTGGVESPVTDYFVTQLLANLAGRCAPDVFGTDAVGLAEAALCKTILTKLAGA